MCAPVRCGAEGCPTRSRSRNVGSDVTLVNICRLHHARLGGRCRVTPPQRRSAEGGLRRWAWRYRAGRMADARIRITPTVSISAADLTWRVSRSGGPGGQHANTSDTRVEVALDLRQCSTLSPHQRALVMARLGPVVRAVGADTRSQARNRELALARLVARLAAALRVDAPRRPTRATRSARERRLQAKRSRSDTKRMRSRPRRDDE